MGDASSEGGSVDVNTDFGHLALEGQGAIPMEEIEGALNAVKNAKATIHRRRATVDVEFVQPRISDHDVPAAWTVSFGRACGAAKV